MPNLLKKLRQDNDLLERQLTQENYKIMQEIVCYLRSADLCDCDLEIIWKDLAGMLLEAQLRNEKCIDVFGDDYRLMCDELIKDGMQKTMYKKLLEVLNILIFSIGVIYIIEFLFSSKLILIVMSCQFTVLITTGLVIAALCTFGIAFCIYYYIAKSSIQLSIHNRIIQILFIIGLLMGWTVTILIRALAGSLLSYDKSCFLFAVFLMIALAVIKYLIYRSDNRNLKVLINRDKGR